MISLTALGDRRLSADLLGTFLICCALLAFEVSTVRTINFAIGPSFIFIAIALAMMGLTAAGSLLSLFDLNAVKARREHVLAGLCIATAALLVGANYFAASEKALLNEIAKAAGNERGLQGLVDTLLFKGPSSALAIGAFLSAPYFLFGALLSYLFATSPTRDYALLYGADLLGAAFGCVLIVFAMEVADYTLAATAPAILAVLAAAAYLAPSQRRIAIGVLCLAAALTGATQLDEFQSRIEPQADANYLVRDYYYSTQREERWVAWNSYTRVAAVERPDAPGTSAVLSLANGDGMAFLFPDDPNREKPLTHRPVIPALIAGDADDALVIFAGAGGDMMSLRENGVSRVTGVEINQQILDAGLALPEYGLKGFLEKDGVTLHIDEARSFLEREDKKYDLVLVSWSGATLVYHLGALGGTTQFVFTYEGLSAILDQVAEGGKAVILQVSKVDALAALRRYMAERGLENPERAAVVLFSERLNNKWDEPWDENPLLIKLDGWTDKDIAEIRQRAADMGDYQIAYAPGLGAHPQYQAYQRVLDAPDPDAEIARLSAESGKAFGYATDDKPFYLDHFDPARYLSADFWFGFPEKFDNFADIYHLLRTVFALVIAGAAFALALLPLAIARRPGASRRRSAVYLAYFLLLGAGFMFIEIAFIQRASMLMSNPGQAIAVVLCAVILSTGLGSLTSNWAFARGLTFRTCSFAVALYAVAIAVLSPSLLASALDAPLAARIALVVVMIAPGGVLMGQLFPQGIALAGGEDKTLTPWAWAINGAMSASVAGLAPLVAQIVGFNALYFIGAALYAAIMLLPLRSPSGSPVVSAA